MTASLTYMSYRYWLIMLARMWGKSLYNSDIFGTTLITFNPTILDQMWIFTFVFLKRIFFRIFYKF